MEKLSNVKKKFFNYVDRIIMNNKVSHSYLIELDNYDDDINYVFSFVKMILCNLIYDDLLNSKDKTINLIDSNNYPDLKIIEPIGTSIRKNQLIELQKDYSNKSLLNGKRIYIIKYADKLNVSSANTMLKFLEEPEDNIIAILLTDNRYKLLETIASRCQILSIKENDTSSYYDDNILELLNCVVNPSLFFIKYKYIYENVIVDKNNLIELIHVIESFIINYIKYNNSLIENFDVTINDILKKSDNSYLLFVLSTLEEDIDKLQYNVNLKLWMDSLFSKFILGGIYD